MASVYWQIFYYYSLELQLAGQQHLCKKTKQSFANKGTVKNQYALSVLTGTFCENGQVILLQFIMSTETNIRLTTKDHQYQALLSNVLFKTTTAMYFPPSNLWYLHHKWHPDLKSLYSTNLKTSSHSLKKNSRFYILLYWTGLTQWRRTSSPLNNK